MNNSAFILLTLISVFTRCTIQNGILEKWRWSPKPIVTIINGEPVSEGQYPSIVSIQQFGKHICGGSILNEFTILTAAHCTIGRNTLGWQAVAGLTDLNDIFSPHFQRSRIYKVIVHPNFEKHSSLYDIAIAKVVTGFMFTPYVNLIHLHITPSIPETGVIVGWGATAENGPISNILLKTTVEVITKEQCIEEYGEDIEYGLICAKTNDGDACNGDSGGPLSFSNNLYGIISSGYGCGHENESALYVEVSYFIDWIIENGN